MTRSILTLTLIPAFAFLTACAGEDVSPEDAVKTSVDSFMSPLETSLEQPTGRLDAMTAPAVFDAYADQEQTERIIGAVPAVGGTGASPQNFGGHPCITSTNIGGTIDMGCATEGEMTGEITYQTAQDNDIVYTRFDYDVCSEGTCIKGPMAMKIETRGTRSTTTTRIDFEVTEDGETHDYEHGSRMVVEGGTVSITYVVWLDGESYVLTLETSGNSATWTVTGMDGAYSCQTEETTDGLWTGTCTDGTDTFEF